MDGYEELDRILCKSPWKHRLKLYNEIPDAGEDTKKLDLPYIASGNVKWRPTSGKQFGIFSQS